jgi:malonyl-CoA O-methyltransferase
MRLDSSADRRKGSRRESKRELLDLATHYDADAIRIHFGAAAKHYDAFSSIQQLTANNLVELIPQSATSVRNGLLLDLGCGTGSTLESYYPKYSGYCIGLDLTHRMLKKAGSLRSVLQADMQQLPIKSQSIDLLISNSACQWVASALVIPEIQRVLKPGGHAFVSLFVSGSLPELKQNQVLQHRVQDLASEEAWLTVIKNSDLSLERKELELHLQEFDTRKELFNSIRGVGASISPDRYKYLGKEAYKTLLSDNAKQNQLSWRTLYLVLKNATNNVDITESNSMFKAV